MRGKKFIMLLKKINQFSDSCHLTKKRNILTNLIDKWNLLKTTYPESRRSLVLAAEGVELDLLGQDRRVGKVRAGQRRVIEHQFCGKRLNKMQKCFFFRKSQWKLVPRYLKEIKTNWFSNSVWKFQIRRKNKLTEPLKFLLRNNKN